MARSTDAVAQEAAADLAFYISVALRREKVWLPGTSFSEARRIPLRGGYQAEVYPTNAGAIYTQCELNSTMLETMAPAA